MSKEDMLEYITVDDLDYDDAEYQDELCVWEEDNPMIDEAEELARQHPEEFDSAEFLDMEFEQEYLDDENGVDEDEYIEF